MNCKILPSTSVEMSAIMAYYDCVDAWNLDGGGSSTLIIRKQNNWVFNNENNGFNNDNSDWYVTNNPSDGSERSDGNHLLVVVKLPEVSIELNSIDETSIKLNVALLSELEKHSNLYILMGKDYYPVQDGLVEISGLKKDTEYTLFLYSKIGDNYINLMTSKTYKTSKTKPTSIEVSVSLFERNGVEQILFRYNVDNSSAVRTIVFIGNDGERHLSASQTIMLEKNIDTYNMIKDGKIEISYIANSLLPEEILLLEEFVIKFDLMFLMDEMVYSTNDAFKNIFE